jgi:hypothetical protein
MNYVRVFIFAFFSVENQVPIKLERINIVDTESSGKKK